MGLISPGGENLLDFLELRQVLSTYDGNLRDPLWWSSLLSFVSFSLLKEMFCSDETVDSTIAPTNIKNLSNMISSIQHDSVQDLFAVRMV